MELLESYLDERSLVLSDATMYHYRLYIGDFLTFAQDNNRPADRTTLYAFLRQPRFANKNTRHSAFRSIRTWSKWCEENGHQSDMTAKFAIPAATHAITPVLDLDEVEALINCIPRDKPRHFRDRALFTLVAYTGLRRGGARLIKLSDLNVHDRWVRVTSKGETTQMIPIPECVIPRLKTWLRLNPSDTWLWPSTQWRNTPLSANRITHMIGTYARRGGLTRKINVHLLRASFATALAEGDVPVDVIQHALGHKDLKTTMIYVRPLTYARRVREATDRVFG